MPADSIVAVVVADESAAARLAPVVRLLEGRAGFIGAVDPRRIGAALVLGGGRAPTGVPVVAAEAGLYPTAPADVHCAPTREAVAVLRGDGIPSARIALTGSTVVEATVDALSGTRPAPARPGARPSILASIDRAENIASLAALDRVLSALRTADADVALIAHPAFLSAVHRFGLAEKLDAFELVEPLDHAASVVRAREADLLVADIEDLEEECTVLKRPLVTVRSAAVLPESVRAGFARLVPPQGDLSAELATALAAAGRVRLDHIPSPYGDGLAAFRIATICRRLADGASVHAALRG